MTDPEQSPLAPDPRWPLPYLDPHALVGRLCWPDPGLAVVDPPPVPSLSFVSASELCARDVALREALHGSLPPVEPTLDEALRALSDWTGFGALLSLRSIPPAQPVPLLARHLHVMRVLMRPSQRALLHPDGAVPHPVAVLPGGNLDRFLLLVAALVSGAVVELQRLVSEPALRSAPVPDLTDLVALALRLGACPAVAFSELEPTAERVGADLGRGLPAADTFRHSIGRTAVSLDVAHTGLVAFVEGRQPLAGVPLVPLTRRGRLADPPARLASYAALSAHVVGYLCDALRYIGQLCYHCVRHLPAIGVGESGFTAAPGAVRAVRLEDVRVLVRAVGSVTRLRPLDMVAFRDLFERHAARCAIPYSVCLLSERGFARAYVARAAGIAAYEWGVSGAHDHPSRSGSYAPCVLPTAPDLAVFPPTPPAAFYGTGWAEPDLSVHADAVDRILEPAVRDGISAFAEPERERFTPSDPHVGPAASLDEVSGAAADDISAGADPDSDRSEPASPGSSPDGAAEAARGPEPPPESPAREPGAAEGAAAPAAVPGAGDPARAEPSAAAPASDVPAAASHPAGSQTGGPDAPDKPRVPAGPRIPDRGRVARRPPSPLGAQAPPRLRTPSGAAPGFGRG